MSNGVQIALILTTVGVIAVGGYLVYQYYNEDGSTAEAKMNHKIVYTR